jgi:hypothetical protein
MRAGLASGVAILLVVLGCRGGTAQAEGGDPYVIIPTLALEAGGQARVTLRIEGRQGFHWNAEYPFKLTVDQQKGASLARADFTARDAAVDKDEVGATINLGPASGATADAFVHAKVNFGLCNGDICNVYRGRDVEWRAAAAQAGGK